MPAVVSRFVRVASGREWSLEAAKSPINMGFSRKQKERGRLRGRAGRSRTRPGDGERRGGTVIEEPI
jgi:hypothetical protein